MKQGNALLRETEPGRVTITRTATAPVAGRAVEEPFGVVDRARIAFEVERHTGSVARAVDVHADTARSTG